ncbi:MAG: 3'-5' exonuclease [Paludibacteraceae bacterium]|nr:3'-5' exonuclease [Paludibacteraceae bacterium]
MNTLNESQYNAVMYNDGPSLIIAGAGSGKTRVLTYKVAQLLREGYAPNSILVLTFTNKAAREMKSRITDMVDPRLARYVAMGTFHSQFSRILRDEHEFLGLTRDFTVYDTTDSKSLIKSIVKQMGLDDKLYTANVVSGRISSAKNRLITPDRYTDKEGVTYDVLHRIPKVKEIFKEYVERCKVANAIDFDDMLLLIYKLFVEHPEVLERYQERFKFILIDEYQDTNLAQYKIIKLLAEKHHRVCVVGDDSQSIYSFRGADISNILQFQNNYPEAKLFKLEKNYRSTENIVKAANSLIDKNSRRIPKTLYSDNGSGHLIKVYNPESETDEADVVVRQINRISRDENVSFNNFAVLYRTNSQSRVIEDKLRKARIPYAIYGSLSFYQRKSVKDILAYLRLVVNPCDDESFLRAIKTPSRGIGDTTLERLRAAAIERGVPLLDVTDDLEGTEIKAAAGKRLIAFTDGIRRLRADMYELNLVDLTKKILEFSGLIAYYSADTQEDEDAKENIEELVNNITMYVEEKENNDEIPTLSSFLTDAALQTDADTEEDVNAEKVSIMTVHASKGLEFDYVFIVGAEEELFPSPKCVADDEIEEERRLMYVAITRAAKRCFILYTKSRLRFGKMIFPQRSRFISEIDDQYLEMGNSFIERNRTAPTHISSTYNPKPVVSNPNPALHKLVKPSVGIGAMASDDASKVKVGDIIEHSHFGVGEVMELIDAPSGRQMKVNFKSQGVKLMILKFVKFKIIG